MRKLTRKEEWYFIKQDIVSYLLSTSLYLVLCLIENFNIHSVIYGLFDCLVFYVPFWFIRINFSRTYHSNSWKHCKFWTRTMLCIGVFVLWLLPVEYSLFNGLFVAFGCCLVLYLVALETDEKKMLKKENEELKFYIENLLLKYNNPKQKLLTICEELCINERDTKVAELYFIERFKPKQIWYWLIERKENMELESVYKLLNRLNHKILPELNKI